MTDNRFASGGRRDCFKEAVCVNASRVYDACRDRECLEDLRVYFVDRDQQIIDNAIGVKLKSAEVINVYIDTEPVPFNRGYYCVDLTIFFSVYLDVTVSPISNPCEVCGLSVYNKKAILFGSEGSVKVFTSDYVYNDDDVQNQPSGNLPKVTCQIAEPISLGAKLSTVCDPCCDCCCVPRGVARRFGGSFDNVSCAKIVEVTLGVFMIIQLERQVQMLMPVYDFCMPEKICVEEGNDDPCDLFGKISFPTDAFFPPKAGECRTA
ncbi:MAG: hypothetical protein IJC18_05965, partial [Clostridia bacterium]|nr:hypothetical protein [Clostridia bacterium]